MKTAAGLAALLALAALTLAPPARAADGKKESKIAVVAAENFYGDIARQIGGDRVTVVSIMNNPDQDPHLFETTPGIVRQIANAQVVVFNGANYDPWMEKLVEGRAATGPPGCPTSPRSPPANPAAIRICGTTPRSCVRVATRARRRFRQDRISAHAKDYSARLDTFEASLKPLTDKSLPIRGKYAGRGHRQRAGVRSDG